MIEILLSIASSGIWSKVWTVAVAILFFGVIIMIHECGHFLFAKLFKVKVNEFSIGMGPAVFKRKKGETQYSVRVLPIGGYVSMEGEDQDSDDDGAFNKKPVWQKMIIVAAGAFMNLLLGVIIMCIMLSTSGDLIGTNTIKSFYDGAVSEQYGLKEGDRFLEIDNEFHRLIFECAGKMWSYHFVEEQMVHFDRLRALAAKSGYAKSTIPDHEDILYALKRKDAEMAEIFMTRHLTRYQTEKTEIMKQYPEYFTE